MNSEPIVFRQGEENGIVIERGDYGHSIMLNQYQQAINIFHRIWTQQQAIIKRLEANQGGQNDIWIDNKTSNIIAFCGDRGEGKSSCMASFATMLTDKEAQTEAKKVLSFPKDENSNDIMLSPDKIEWLDVIDPSFFDEEHNLLELLLGRICIKAQHKCKIDSEKDCTNVSKHRRLMEQLQVVKRCVSVMTPKKDKPLYDSIEEISELAAGMQLKCELQKLFNCYLEYVGKKCLLICVDDIDLNIKEGYKMAEMMRKYLICPYCVVMVAVKVEQLIDVIATAHKKEVKDSEIRWQQCQLMAQKYVVKLLPREHRIIMPDFIDICERKIQLADKSKDAKISDMTVKERVVQLIFQKTGYVFYNSQSISPIVPRNLRSLRHLLGSLELLPDARTEKWGDDETGREVFKDYFFGTWATTNLDSKDYDFANQISQYDDIATLNAYVVEYFATRVKKAEIEIKERQRADNKRQVKMGYLDDDDAETYTGDFAPLYIQITNRTNTSANISVGDVMYILWLISTITVDSAIQNLIFFIKTIYSMRLYSCYNEVTAGKGETLFPEATISSNRISIHKSDSLYDKVNRIQRITNGSYFSYPDGALLSNRRDRIIIDFRKVKGLFTSLKEEAKKKEEDRNANYNKTVQLCEFLAMCITTASTKENIEKVNFSREAKTPTFLGTFSHTANSAIFDFLNPFYALTNIKYCYHRFDEILSDNPNTYNDNDDSQQNKLYNIAENCKESLLEQLKQIRKGTYKDKWDMHGLVSDAIIRVADIQWAIYEELLRQYRTHRVGSIAGKIYHAYGDIQKLQITLYPSLTINEGKVIKGHDAHLVEFDFLTVLRTFLNSDENATRLNDILTISETDKLLADTGLFLGNVQHALMNIYVWPMTGEEIKALLKEASLLKKNQQSSFSARIGKVFASEGQYSKEEVLNKFDLIRDIYMTARLK